MIARGNLFAKLAKKPRVEPLLTLKNLLEYDRLESIGYDSTEKASILSYTPNTLGSVNIGLTTRDQKWRYS